MDWGSVVASLFPRVRYARGYGSIAAAGRVAARRPCQTWTTCNLTLARSDRSVAARAARAASSELSVARRSECEHDDLASMHNCINTEVRFRALLTEGGDPRVQLHSA